MKKVLVLVVGMLLSSINLLIGQSSLGIDSVNYSAPSTANYNSSYKFVVKIKNHGPQVFTGIVDVMYAVDSTTNNSAPLDTTNSHLTSSLSIAVGAEKGDSILMSVVPSIFRTGINTVVIWPRTNSSIVTHDSLKIHVLVLGYAGIKNYSETIPILFPNPVQNHLFIANKDPYFIIEQVRVFDATGQLVCSEKFKGSIDASKLSSGVYILEFSDKDGKTHRNKIIKE
ncbi:MAG TPA: T9SS type A sorting domain-containing protein [Bacteroidia bacterium]|jgi:hypothetical protein|nr:T9SS type A sorting domain-containing protein [Bacteroidia bacterium]